MKGSRMFPRLLSGLAVAVCLAAAPPIGTAQVSGPVTLTKTFTNDPVLPGASVTLEFTIENFDQNNSVAADIGFTDDLDAVVSGLVATGLPASNVCGPGSQVTGTSLLTFTGGSVAAGASCTFSVTLLVPGGAAPGDHLNTTSTLTTELEGRPLVGEPATDTLTVLAVVVVAVPTLEWWGLLLLVGLLGLTAWWRLRSGQMSPPASA
jgi:hypothetical protein